MIVAQCDAMLSLTDDSYYERAWCSVEVAMIQVLVRSYSPGQHQWLEVRPRTGPGPVELVEGKADLNFDVATLKLTHESDRHQVAFLHRQSKILES